MESVKATIPYRAVSKGLEEQMKRFLNEHPGTQLIIIDTLKMVREGKDDSYS